jgi:hypothetical protein
MVERDGLTDDQIPMSARYNAPIVGNLYETKEARKERKAQAIIAVPPMTLVETRNSQMHGYPDSLPRGGLLELGRDLIEFAYRHMIAEAHVAYGWRATGDAARSLQTGGVGRLVRPPLAGGKVREGALPDWAETRSGSVR